MLCNCMLGASPPAYAWPASLGACMQVHQGTAGRHHVQSRHTQQQCHAPTWLIHLHAAALFLLLLLLLLLLLPRRLQLQVTEEPAPLLRTLQRQHLRDSEAGGRVRLHT